MQAAEGPIHVFLVEDDDVTAEILAEMLAAEPGIVVVGVAASAAAALAQLGRVPTVDVFVVDLGLGEESGVDFIRALRERGVGAELLAHTVFDDRGNVFAALEAGATGYVLKGGPAGTLARAIREVVAGGAPMSPHVARLVIGRLHSDPEPDVLSPRERLVLQCIDRGLSYKEVAAELGVSVHTVHSHIKRCYERLHASGKRRALAEARRRGLL